MKFVAKPSELKLLPILEYASTIWSPHLQCQIQQLEKAHHSAARFVTNDFHAIVV